MDVEIRGNLQPLFLKVIKGEDKGNSDMQFINNTEARPQSENA